MYDRWSLDVLYKGLDDPKFAEDRKKLSEAIEEMIALADEWEKNPDANRREMTKKTILLREKFELLVFDLDVEPLYCYDTLICNLQIAFFLFPVLFLLRFTLCVRVDLLNTL